ncbi:hypothetical protein KM043_017578 [Ampulex compressa]|nr:hypothetical protein KM043_017578 [Ampulex compressa]
MSKMADITIPVFDGEDYGSWKKRITMFLKMKKCDVIITREKIKTDKEDDWLEKDLRAINYIYGAISNKQLEFVQDKETAFEIIKKFDELYLKESIALQIICRNKLEKLILNNYSDTAEFFSEFARSVNNLKAAEAKVTEKEKMNYMLRTLPGTYSYIGDLVDVLKEEDQIVDYVKNKIKMFELKGKGDEKSNLKSNAFSAELKSNRDWKNQACHICGKVGHFKRDCRQAGTSSGSWKYSQYQRGAQSGSGHHEGTQGRGNNQTGHWTRGRDQQWSGHGTFSVTVETHIANSEVKSNKEINWLLDSGCTDHIINNDKYFSKYETLQKPTLVKVGYGR